MTAINTFKYKIIWEGFCRKKREREKERKREREKERKREREKERKRDNLRRVLGNHAGLKLKD